MNAQQWAVVWLVTGVVISGLGLVLVQHERRMAFVELQAEIERGDELREEWSMLQLEIGAWAGHSRLERVARDELQMQFPEHGEVVILERR
ncbi:cell division protein FtsL [Halorhodospira abdelmalekii]|uniref:cell division protein FtsL n=1 Tax=Halorhodospira abdelmalekii TaxID=421629 RepID=UPI00190548AC|nr:cell division protein FtsL [Halorhodospira abdelmalekii]